jgi:WD40 repeat protein
VPSGEQLRTHKCRIGDFPPLGIAFSPDSLWLAWPENGPDDHSLVVSEAATGTPVQTFVRPDPLWLASTVAYHPGGRLLVTGHVDGNVSVYELTPGPDVAALCLALAGPNPSNTLVHAWRLTTPHQAARRPIQAHIGRLVQAVFSPDGKWLATTGGADETLKIWEVETWELRHELRAHVGGACSVAFSRDGKRLATGGEDAVVRIWDCNDGHPTERLALCGHGDTVYSVAFDESGLRVASGGRDRVVKIWDLGTAFEAAGPHQPGDANHGK